LLGFLKLALRGFLGSLELRDHPVGAFLEFLLGSLVSGLKVIRDAGLVPATLGSNAIEIAEEASLPFDKRWLGHIR
jgi:hypothetical protein